MGRLKRFAKRVAKKAKSELSDPATLASIPGGLPAYAGRKIAGGIKHDVTRAVQHPSPSSVTRAGLSVASVLPGLGAERAATRTPGFLRGAEEVFRANRARTAATRATRLRSAEVPAFRTRAGATLGRSAELIGDSTADLARYIRSEAPSRATLVRSVRAGGAAGGISALSARIKGGRSASPASFHPLVAEESPAEGLRKVAEFSRVAGPAGTRALIEGQRAARSTFYAAGNRSMTPEQKRATLRMSVVSAFARNLKDERRKLNQAAALRVTRQ